MIVWVVFWTLVTPGGGGLGISMHEQKHEIFEYKRECDLMANQLNRMPTNLPKWRIYGARCEPRVEGYIFEELVPVGTK